MTNTTGTVAYKYKPDKHGFRVNVQSLDEMHREKITSFQSKRDALPEKKAKIAEMTTRLRELEENLKGKVMLEYIELFRERNKLKTEIKNLQNEIEKIENYVDETQYYSKVGDVVENYYSITNGILYGKDDLCEEPEKVSDTKITVSKELLAITNSNKTRKLKRPVRKRSKNIGLDQTTPGLLSTLMNVQPKQQITEQPTQEQCKATLQNQYLLMMDKEYASTKARCDNIPKCKECMINMDAFYDKAIAVCPKCNGYEKILVESEVPMQRETFAEKPRYPYKRIGHGKERLDQFLCLGTPNIHKSVYTTILSELTKHNIEPQTATLGFIEKMLKKHKLSNCYDYIMFIYCRITQKKPIQVSREEYDKVLEMFAEAEEIYETKYKPRDRENFLKYTFVLHKIFLTIGRKDIAKYFTLLKSDNKMKQQEKVWKNICGDTGWVYHPS
jgi:hypothetical protein